MGGAKVWGGGERSSDRPRPKMWHSDATRDYNRRNEEETKMSGRRHSWTHGRPLQILTDSDCESDSETHAYNPSGGITGTPAAKGSKVQESGYFSQEKNLTPDTTPVSPSILSVTTHTPAEIKQLPPEVKNLYIDMAPPGGILGQEFSRLGPRKRSSPTEQPVRVMKRRSTTSDDSRAKKARRNACGECPNCLKDDCGKCIPCKDKKKFGGPGTRKKRCIERRCERLPLKRQSKSKQQLAHKQIKAEPDDTELGSSCESDSNESKGRSKCKEKLAPEAIKAEPTDTELGSVPESDSDATVFANESDSTDQETDEEPQCEQTQLNEELVVKISLELVELGNNSDKIEDTAAETGCGANDGVNLDEDVRSEEMKGAINDDKLEPDSQDTDDLVTMGQEVLQAGVEQLKSKNQWLKRQNSELLQAQAALNKQVQTLTDSNKEQKRLLKKEQQESEHLKEEQAKVLHEEQQEKEHLKELIKEEELEKKHLKEFMKEERQEKDRLVSQLIATAEYEAKRVIKKEEVVSEQQELLMKNQQELSVLKAVNKRQHEGLKATLQDIQKVLTNCSEVERDAAMVRGDSAMDTHPHTDNVEIHTGSEHLSTAHLMHGTHIPGMNVIGEVRIPFDRSSEKTFNWQGYGMKLHVPNGAIPHSLDKCTVTVRVGLSGQFQLPPGCSLVSGIYQLQADPPIRFIKPVTVEIEHCDPCQDPSTLSFAIAETSKGEVPLLPYKFGLQAGVFTTSSSYGSISIHHFTKFSITKYWPLSVLTGKPPVVYCGRFFFFRKWATELTAHFVITRDLAVEKMSVERKLKEVYPEKEYQMTSMLPFKIEFEEDEVCLDIPEDGDQTKEGWKITPSYHPAISKEDVEHAQQCESDRIPTCQLHIHWKKKLLKPVDSIYKIRFKGAKHPRNFFNMKISSTMEDSTTASNPLPHQSGHLVDGSGNSHEDSDASSSGSSQLHQTDSIPTDWFNQQKLFIPDSAASSSASSRLPIPEENLQPGQADLTPKLKDLMRYLRSRMAAKWRLLGVQLELDVGSLDTLSKKYNSDPDHCLVDMLDMWRKGKGSATTWPVIIEAIQAIGDRALASDIATEHS